MCKSALCTFWAWEIKLLPKCLWCASVYFSWNLLKSMRAVGVSAQKLARKPRVYAGAEKIATKSWKVNIIKYIFLSDSPTRHYAKSYFLFSGNFFAYILCTFLFATRVDTFSHSFPTIWLLLARPLCHCFFRIFVFRLFHCHSMHIMEIPKKLPPCRPINQEFCPIVYYSFPQLCAGNTRVEIKILHPTKYHLLRLVVFHVTHIFKKDFNLRTASKRI